MPVTVAHAVARPVNEWARTADFDVIWHGGEPLTAGREHLGDLFRPFRGVRHHIQTNATLINSRWCDFFTEHDVRVGVSIDGPAVMNTARVTLAGQAAYDRIVRGIAQLRVYGIDFSVIAVVSDPDPAGAAELYQFFVDLGCSVVGFNVEEQEGVNIRSQDLDPARVAEFWAALTEAWRANPVVRIREVERVLGYAAAEFEGRADDFLPDTLDPFPTVAHDGEVVVLSPELSGFQDQHERGFAAGNVLTRGLGDILADAAAQRWVGEFRAGLEACRQTCPYFAFCGGGQPANRYFEHGRFDGTRTAHCQHSRISLLEGVLAHARTHH
jgi:uncharacterized protein